MSGGIWAECARVAAGGLASGGRGRGGGGLAAVATVVRRRGSLPMSATARMLVTASGARIGTVGGGCLEAEIVDRAVDVMEHRTPVLSKHTLNSSLAGDYGLTCGGTATLFIEPVFAAEPLAAVYGAAADLWARGGSAAVVTETSWPDEPRKAIVAEDGGVLAGTVSANALRAARALAPEVETPLLRRGYVLEPVLPAPPLLVFGGGHVGGAVARAAAFAGWDVTVIDDREDFADLRRHPVAARTVCCDFHDVSSVLPLSPRTFAVVATRGHQHDALIVEQLAGHDLRYVGMLGSRRKVALTWKLLESWGVPAARLQRIHAPVGLAIGADTPEEIAVSVVAEMIAVRRAGSARRGGQAALFSSRMPYPGAPA